MTTTLTSFGHGTADREELLRLFEDVQVRRVVDVRRFPNSRHNLDVRHDALATWLPQAGIDYLWEERLGGRRTLPRTEGAEPDPWWRVKSFRAYAAHTRTPDFRTALDELIGGLDAFTEGTILFMCSESLWWRCHRRLISATAQLLADVDVQHLDHQGKLTAHQPSPGARVADNELFYDVMDDADAAGPADRDS
ncbi:MAG: DUF488 domain-containing protein [Nocardioides sp.]|nr:DUF488 domain-containing protein [Nocardioides sp.]